MLPFRTDTIRPTCPSGSPSFGKAFAFFANPVRTCFSAHPPIGMTFDSHRALPHSSRVKGRRIASSATRRWIALMTLFAWVTAFGLCTVHCALGMTVSGMGSNAVSSCHGGGHSSDSDGQSTATGSFCITVKSLSAETHPPEVHAPQTPALFQPAIVTFISVYDLARPFLISLRQPQDRDKPFTPEVCLGPTHLPHGPPASR